MCLFSVCAVAWVAGGFRAGLAVAVQTCLTDLRGALAPPGRQYGDHTLTDAWAPLLDAAAQRRVRLAAVGVLHADHLAAGALQHLAARGSHGTAGGGGGGGGRGRGEFGFF